MVRAMIEGGILRLELSPLHKVLALKGSLEIPLLAIESVEMNREVARSGPDGTRNPGTSVPHLIHAGTFNSGVKRAFWDVHNPENAIRIKLKSSFFSGIEDRYDEIVVEVAHPAETVIKIEQAITAGT